MSSLKVSDVFCHICRGILIEPVTLPCSHVFCLTCFEQSMQETSHSCPFCRKRISNWIRSVKKSNSLVNVQLWEKIKEQFKEQVNLKLNGEDDGLDQFIQKENPVLLKTSKPGEAAQEFSHLLHQIKYEDERIKKNAELASKKLIEKLQKEEEENLKLVQKINLQRMKDDERMAYLLQEEFNKERSNARPSTRSSSAEGDKPTIIGPMDSFAKGLTDSGKVRTRKNSSILEETDLEVLSGRSSSTDSTDSLRLEMNLFKPIKKALTTPPKRYPDGRIKEINLTRVVPLKLTFSDSTFSDRILKEGKNIHSNHSAFADTNSYLNSEEYFESPSKRLRLSVNKSDTTTALKSVGKENNETSQTDITESTIRKVGDKSRLSTFSTTSPCQILEEEDEDFDTQEYLNPDSTIEEKLIEEQRRIEKIILQEKTDREFAMKLCQEWDAEDNKKPQTRSMMAEALKKNKVQKTIMESFSSKKSKKL